MSDTAATISDMDVKTIPRPTAMLDLFTDAVRAHLRLFGIFATDFRLQHFRWHVQIRLQDTARAWYPLSDVLNDPDRYRTGDV